MGKHSIDEKRSKRKAAKREKNRIAREQRSNENRKKRKILSYENVPIDEYKDYSNEKSFKITKQIVKRFVLILVILLLLFGLIMGIANKDKLTWDNISMWFSETFLGESSGDGYPTEIVGTTVGSGNFILVDGRPAYASDTSYIELGESAGEVINSQLSYSNPVIRGTRHNTIVYGVGSNDYMLHDTKKMIYKGSTKDGIFTADTNDSGEYIVVTGGNGYLSVLTAYDENNKKMYEYSFADYYVTCASINSSGDGAVCCGITTKNGAEHTKVYVLDFKKTKPLYEYDIPESTIYDTFYLSSDMVAAVSNNAVFTIDFDESKPSKMDYNSRTLTAYCFNPDTKTFAISLSRSGDGRNCDIISFNSSGEQEYTIKSKYKVTSLSLYKGSLGIISEGVAYTLDEEGNVEGKAKSGNDGQALLLCDTDEAYVLGISEIRKIELK